MRTTEVGIVANGVFSTLPPALFEPGVMEDDVFFTPVPDRDHMKADTSVLPALFGEVILNE